MGAYGHPGSLGMDRIPSRGTKYSVDVKGSILRTYVCIYQYEVCFFFRKTATAERAYYSVAKHSSVRVDEG